MSFLVWIIIALALGVLEIFTVGFFMLFFATGAALTAFIALFIPDLSLQLAVFIVASLVFVLLGRPLLRTWFHIGDKPAKASNIQTLPGQKVLVLQAVDRYQGQVKVLHTGETWSAYLDETIGLDNLPKGQEARIMRVDGAKLVINPL